LVIISPKALVSKTGIFHKKTAVAVEAPRLLNHLLCKIAISAKLTLMEIII
jgi:hypothetical protein